jgi:uncharacterized protein YndB with AHSA1/START domain
MDIRVGGTWRVVQVDEQGEPYGFHGEYREIVPPGRLVSTFEVEGMLKQGVESGASGSLDRLADPQTRPA